MLEVANLKKHKIELSEYDFETDIQNRVFMAQFSPLDVEILEEILYSSLRIPISLLEQNLDLSREELLPIFEKLSQTKLFSIERDFILVDKEMRKYYEVQILKFEEDFKPGMEYLQGLLKKVPIHTLPLWYSISRTSNNIFESIVEKYLHSPQIFQRYLMELHLSDPIQTKIMNALYQSPNYELDASDMMKKFDLTQEQFEEHMLHLEFNFVCCIKYVRKGKSFQEVITPFYEWREYLCQVQNRDPISIIDEEKIKRLKKSDFAFIEEMSSILEHKSESLDEYLVEKLCDLHLAYKEKDKLLCTDEGKGWLKMDLKSRALFIYRHPLHTLNHEDLSEELCNERTLREAEKCITSVVYAGWVYLEDFLQGIFIPLKESQVITLKHIGKTWKYQLPKYAEVELNFFRAVIGQWLFEVGITALGTKEGRTCFCVTPFGQELFGNE